MTNLQKLYDRFFAKVDEDLTGKEGQIFNLVDSAIARSYKTVNNSLEYELDNEEDYTGYFKEELDNDEIELLALWMLYEWNRKKQQKLVGQKSRIGTKDFNKVGDLRAELATVEFAMEKTLEDINYLKNEFYTYKN